VGAAVFVRTLRFNLHPDTDEEVYLRWDRDEMVAALKNADRAYVLETGRVVLEGSGQELLEHPRLQQAYFGRRVCQALGVDCPRQSRCKPMRSSSRPSIERWVGRRAATLGVRGCSSIRRAESCTKDRWLLASR
jgi:hypothetical protein